MRSFGVIRVRISDPRSVWIMGHQRNRRIHSGPNSDHLKGTHSLVPLMYHDPDRSWITDPNSDHPKERTQKFALTRFLMKPFPLTGLSRAQRIFNYRLSRMRRISENCFGIIANRWRVFRAPILLPPDTVILVALVLHNFLR